MDNDLTRSARRKVNDLVSREHLLDERYSIRDLVDITRLRRSFEEFSKVTGFTTGFVSYPDQEILISTGWRDACTKYHRHCPASAEACRESNIHLTTCLKNLKELSIKPCGNGLVDGATPVIIRGKHLASVSTGQVMFEPPDLAFFKRQAKKYGYDVKAYLAAIRQVPVVNKQQFKQVLRYLSSLAVFLAEEGLNALRVGESEEKYRVLFEGTRDAIIIRDSTGGFLDCNAAALRLFKWRSKDDLASTHPTDFSSAKQEDGRDSATVFAEHIKQACLDGFCFFEWLIKTRDGTVIPTEVLFSRLEMGGKTVFQSVVRDISERKRAEDAVQQSEKELADFFRTSLLGLLWVKPDGRILRVNDTALELLGCTSREVLSKPVSRFHVDPEAVTDLLHRLAKGETLQNCHQRIRRKDRSIIHVLIDANGLWKNNRLIYSRWFVRDISRRVELEGEILRISEREQRRIGHDLHDDLCQQLAGISFLTETLAKHLPENSPVFVAEAKGIARLTQTAMIQAREMASGLSPVPLEAEGLMDALKALAERTKRIFQIDCHFQCEKPVLVPDHTVGIHLYRIAQEAVANSVKHGKAGRIDIGLTANGSNVVLAVNDNGLGIPVKLRKHKGMGLRIMQYRAGVIGGSLLVQHNPNGGTTVVCTVLNGLMPPKEMRSE